MEKEVRLNDSVANVDDIDPNYYFHHYPHSWGTTSVYVSEQKTTTGTEYFPEEIRDLAKKVDMQNLAVSVLGSNMSELISINKKMLIALESLPQHFKPEEEEVIQLRNISKGQAKTEIFSLLNKNPGFDYYDISKELKIDIEEVVIACKELLKEKAIGEIEN